LGFLGRSLPNYCFPGLAPPFYFAVCRGTQTSFAGLGFPRNYSNITRHQISSQPRWQISACISALVRLNS
jgi:hypothetical protein